MTSLLQPGYTLTLGSQRWTTQLIALELTLAAAPLLNGLTVTLPAQAPLKSAPGDPADLTLASGEKEQAVFSGTIDSIRHSPDAIRVRALDAAGVLAQVRPAITWEQADRESTRLHPSQ